MARKLFKNPLLLLVFSDSANIMMDSNNKKLKYSVITH